MKKVYCGHILAPDESTQIVQFTQVHSVGEHLPACGGGGVIKPPTSFLVQSVFPCFYCYLGGGVGGGWVIWGRGVGCLRLVFLSVLFCRYLWQVLTL